MISYLINNIRVFFTFIYVFFQDYTRIIYPFVDSIEEKTNLINLALFLEKLPENFGEDNQEKIEELNQNIENKSNELNNSESLIIEDNTPLILSEIQEILIKHVELNIDNDDTTSRDEEIKILEDNKKKEEEIQVDISEQVINEEISKINVESKNNVETISQEDNKIETQESERKKSEVSKDNNLMKEINIVENKDNIDSKTNTNNLSEVLKDSSLHEKKDASTPTSKNKKDKKNKAKNKNTFQELEKVTIEKF